MNWRALARAYARKHGINPTYFERQMAQEAHGQDLRSPAGAQGPAQIMPGTAKAWGVKNVHDIHQAYDAAAAHMASYLKQFGGSWAKALAAYNGGPGVAQSGKLPAETRNYIATILGGKGDVRDAGGTTYGVKNVKVTEGPTTQQDVKGAIVDTLLSGTKPQNLGMTVLRKLAYDPKYTVTKPGKTRTIPSPTGPQSLPTGGRHGGFAVSPGANRPGVPLAGDLRSYLSELSGLAGSFTVGTGSRHSKFTVSGNVSDHWTGHGADVPATGAKLIQLGQQALIAAGMNPAQARKQRGGLYNLRWRGRRVQIIFNTNGPGVGDHTTHLHVGVH